MPRADFVGKPIRSITITPEVPSPKPLSQSRNREHLPLSHTGVAETGAISGRKRQRGCKPYAAVCAHPDSTSPAASAPTNLDPANPALPAKVASPLSSIQGRSQDLVSGGGVVEPSKPQILGKSMGQAEEALISSCSQLCPQAAVNASRQRRRWSGRRNWRKSPSTTASMRTNSPDKPSLTSSGFGLAERQCGVRLRSGFECFNLCRPDEEVLPISRERGRTGVFDLDELVELLRAENAVDIFVAGML